MLCNSEVELVCDPSTLQEYNCYDRIAHLKTAVYFISGNTTQISKTFLYYNFIRFPVTSLAIVRCCCMPSETFGRNGMTSIFRPLKKSHIHHRWLELLVWLSIKIRLNFQYRTFSHLSYSPRPQTPETNIRIESSM